MNTKYLFAMLMIVPGTAMASCPSVFAPKYEQCETNESTTPARFYVGAMYDFTMWQNDNDGTFVAKGKNSSAYEAMIGVRATNFLRLEANYAHLDARWRGFSLRGETAFVNAIVDARIDEMYRSEYTQHVVPYVGLGMGLAWEHAHGATEISHDIMPVFAGMAGIGIDATKYLTFDLGYRYVYMLSPRFNNIHDMNPRGHQFRAGMRINF